MNKPQQRIISRCMLIIFTCNTIFSPAIQAMGIPATFLVQQIPVVTEQVATLIERIPSALLAAGSCIAGLAAARWTAKTSFCPVSIKREDTAIQCTESIVCQNNTLSQSNETHEPNIHTVAQSHTLPHTTTQQPLAINTNKTEVASEQLKANSEIKQSHDQIVDDPDFAQWPQSHPDCFVVSSKKEEPTFTNYDEFERYDGPGSIEYSNGIARYGVKVKNDGADSFKYLEERVMAKRKPFIEKLFALASNEQEREALIDQLQDIKTCFLDIASHDLIKRIQGCLSLSSLSICSPYDENFNDTIVKMQCLLMHKDGTLCRAGVRKQTHAHDLAFDLVRWIDEEINPVIPRSAYISDQEYTKLKSRSSCWLTKLIKRLCPATGRHCPVRQLPTKQARKSNEALQECIDYCQNFDFASAKELLKYDNSGLMKDIIEYYQNVKRQEHAATYDNHGILRIAQNDPLYKQYKQQLEKLPKKQLEPINENFLARHNVKSIMQEHWNIPDNAPAYVHDALYTIMDTDCSTLADITLLQECIEQIIASAPADQHAELTKAFVYKLKTFQRNYIYPSRLAALYKRLKLQKPGISLTP
jgi:CHASE3 domain sensor protein